MKFKHIFLPLFIIWNLDFISTFVGLNLIDGLKEMNPISAYFISLGWYGWFLVYGYMFLVVTIFSLIIYFGYKFDYQNWRKEGIAFYFAYVSVGILFLVDFFIVVANVMTIIIYY